MSRDLVDNQPHEHRGGTSGRKRLYAGTQCACNHKLRAPVAHNGVSDASARIVISQDQLHIQERI